MPVSELSDLSVDIHTYIHVYICAYIYIYIYIYICICLCIFMGYMGLWALGYQLWHTGIYRGLKVPGVQDLYIGLSKLEQWRI